MFNKDQIEAIEELDAELAALINKRWQNEIKRFKEWKRNIYWKYK